ncbi:MAG: fibronectin type III domain-containing protein, partial [Planctomycetota bacterium]|jgi:hypothetical protein
MTKPTDDGIDGTGIHACITTGSEGQLGLHMKDLCRDNLGGGGCPYGNPAGDPIANTFLYAVDWAGPSAGDILLMLTDMPPGEYWLYSYHNHWEPCSQGTRNCLQCECGMPPMPTITANPAPSSPPAEYNGYSLPLGTGTGVTQIENAYDVWPTHYYLDSQLVPSLIKFETDGSEVLVIYEADNTLWPDCARPGREGSRAILNAFELIWMGPGGPDTSPPSPDPATFASPPAAVSSTEITMTATTGSDPSGPVEYYFDETSGNPGGDDSGWVTDPVYNDTGLQPDTQYTYTVQMRDSLLNTGTASAPASAPTPPVGDTEPPTPDPATFASPPAAVSSTEITMTATTGSDASPPVEYYFDETSGNPGGSDSTWTTNPAYNDTGLDPDTQYTYTVQMRDSLANTGTASAPASATTLPDTDPPTPDPATFASPPAAISTTEITMTATTGSDLSGPVEYFFDETSGNPGGSDSTWTTDPVYNDTGLDPGTQYTYTVQMRDSLGNTGTVSAPASATTPQETDPPTPNPATFASPPAAVSTSEITMTATTGSDASPPVEYLFDETSGNPGGSDSTWTTNPVYNDTGLDPDTQYTYTVQMRDSLGNTGNASAPASATTDPSPDTDPPTPNPATFASPPAAVSDTEITMTATTGSDASPPVEYYFDETSGNPGGSDSGWITNTTYNDTGLSAETQYTYTVQMRDSVGNTGTASAPASATTDPKSYCGAAPMYRDSAIANISAAGSCTNALLPLIPSILCLGFWSIRRRKRRQQG